MDLSDIADLSNLLGAFDISSSHQYLTNVQWWNIRFDCETIRPTQKFTSMSCVITWAWAFFTSEVVEAYRGQKHHILAHALAL